MKKIKSIKCPDSETLLAFSEGVLARNGMVSANEHLMECDVCLKEVFAVKRMLESTGGHKINLPEGLKEKALIVAQKESKFRKSMKYLSEFTLSLTDKGISYISNILLPDEATLNIIGTPVPAGEFRSGVSGEKESLIIEESLKGITLKIALVHTRGLHVTIRVFLLKDNVFIKNQRIILYQDKTLLSSKITSKEGLVELPDLSYGYYSIKVPSEDIELRFRIYPQDAKEL